MGDILHGTRIRFRPIFTSPSESEACEFFHRHMVAQVHLHLVGWYLEAAAAVALEERIRRLGVVPVRNDIPCWRRQGDYRYRVFVKGKAIFPVRQAIPEVPIIEDPHAPEFLRKLRYGEFDGISPA